jgi:hypothetical protein
MTNAHNHTALKAVLVTNVMFSEGTTQSFWPTAEVQRCTSICSDHILQLIVSAVSVNSFLQYYFGNTVATI